MPFHYRSSGRLVLSLRRAAAGFEKSYYSAMLAARKSVKAAGFGSFNCRSLVSLGFAPPESERTRLL